MPQYKHRDRGLPCVTTAVIVAKKETMESVRQNSNLKKEPMIQPPSTDLPEKLLLNTLNPVEYQKTFSNATKSALRTVK